MARRNEIRTIKNIPPIFTLLEKGLQKNEPLAIINLILTIITNEKSDEEWKYADFLIKSLNKCMSAASWWYETSRQGNIEGDLIIGWLVKYGLIYDPDEIGYKERFLKVSKKGWYIPQWLLDDIIVDSKEVDMLFVSNKNVIQANIKTQNNALVNIELIQDDLKASS
jgi:hypothetical protein